MSLFKLLDLYTLRARLGPALIVSLPLGMGLAAWFPGADQLKGLPLGAALTVALGLLLAQLGRDAGRKAEPGLFERWGGMPTTKMLSHEHSTLNPNTLRAIHSRLRLLRPDVVIPADLAAERANPVDAMASYGSCVDSLRDRTRKVADHPLIFEENANYGFRRNLWAMRASGWLAALLGLVSSASASANTWIVSHTVSPFPTVYALACAALLVWWSLRITPNWVRLPAEAYAQRLLESCLRD